MCIVLQLAFFHHYNRIDVNVKAAKERWEGLGYIFKKVARKGLTEKMAFEWRTKRLRGSVAGQGTRAGAEPGGGCMAVLFEGLQGPAWPGLGKHEEIQEVTLM